MEIEVKFGLCNRLQTIIGFFTYNNKNTIDVVWKENEECPGKFEDYFEKIPNINFIEKKTEKYLGNFYRFPYEEYELKDTYQSDFIRNHRIIRPYIEIRDYIKTLKLENVIGIHIRRTDFLPYVKKNFSDIVPEIDNNYFHKLIKNILIENPKQKVFLATDNYENQNMFYQLFPKNIIFRKIIDKKQNKKRHTDLKDAIIDLFCLIECKEFYGTKESSFSKFVENYRYNKF